MIIASLLLIVGAAAMLGLGLWHSSSMLLSGSIAASLLAAVVLVVGTRRGMVSESPRAQSTSIPAGASPEPAVPAGRVYPSDRSQGQAAEPPPRSASPSTATIPAQGSPTREGPVHARPARAQHPPVSPPREQASDYADDEDLPDEPAPQQVSPADAARVGQMATEVLVVDGRPRYHLSGCVHLLGREREPLPVSEAIALGFTPCSLCEPDSALLADARRR